MHTHLEGEGRLEDDVHRAEVTEASEKQFRTQMLLDAIAEKLNVSVSQDELTQYLVQSAAQYGMAPQDFVEALQENNQLPSPGRRGRPQQGCSRSRSARSSSSTRTARPST